MNNKIYLSTADEEWHLKRQKYIRDIGDLFRMIDGPAPYATIIDIHLKQGLDDGYLTAAEVDEWKSKYLSMTAKPLSVAYLQPEDSKILLYREKEPCKINWWAIGAILAFVGAFITFMMWGG